MSKKNILIKTAVHKQYGCNSEFGCPCKEDCIYCGGLNTSYDCCECVADEFAAGFSQGYDAGKTDADGNTSDGNHTFNELYEFRMLYNAAFANMYAEKHPDDVIKSKRHHDGELCFGGGWFIVMINLPSGQISNHYEEKYWDLFHCKSMITAPEWDGHTPQDVLNRLNEYVNHGRGDE